MSHLSYEQRYTIQVLLESKKTKKEIASIISVDKSVLSREIKRNCDARSNQYKAKLAQSKYENRLRTKPKQIKFNESVKTKVIELIQEDYSPEQVSGFLKKENQESVSHETIYQFIWIKSEKVACTHICAGKEDDIEKEVQVKIVEDK